MCCVSALRMSDIAETKKDWKQSISSVADYRGVRGFWRQEGTGSNVTVGSRWHYESVPFVTWVMKTADYIFKKNM